MTRLKPVDKNPYLEEPPIHKIKEIDATGFKNHKVNIKYRGNKISIIPSNEFTDFQTMNKARRESTKNPCDVEDIIRDLYSNSTDSFVPHNIGVSAAITTTLNVKGKKRRFALLVYQDRTHTIGNKVYKLPSEFVDASELFMQYSLYEAHLSNQMAKGIAEEVLVQGYTEEASKISGKPRPQLLSGHLINSAFDVLNRRVVAQKSEKEKPQETLQAKLKDKTQLPKSYETSGYIYSKEKSYSVSGSEFPAFLPCLDPNQRVEIAGIPTNGKLCIDKKNKSAQLIYPLEITLPEVSGLSLSHAEDCQDPNKGPGNLMTLLDSSGLVLLELNRAGKPLGEVYWLKQGELIQADNLKDIELSEAFVTSHKDSSLGLTNIVENIGIPFKDYMKISKRRN